MKKKKVKNWYNEVTMGKDIVPRDASIQGIIEKLMEDPKRRSVYVVNEKGNLIGIVTVKDILKFLGLQFLEASMYEQVREAFAETAEDLMKEPISVSLDDSVDSVLKIFIDRELEEIPVLNKKGEIVGDLDCFELIFGLMEDERSI